MKPRKSNRNSVVRIEYEKRTKGGGLMLFSEFHAKEVINIRDCKRLGKVSDFEFDECNGCIHKLIVPGNSSKLFSFFHCDEGDYVIPYKNIKQIGPDIILVDICT